MIHTCWTKLFEKHKNLLSNINTYLEQFDEKLIYPPKKDIFRVFEMDINDINIVLLGQDPYHQEGQAHGLSFSVPNNIKTPPSLVNIFKEIQNEFPERNYIYNNGNLDRWFYEEKIFLLNSSLTVLNGKAGVFMNLWKEFTDDVIEYISKNNNKCIFLLLGNYAISKEKLINNKERIIKTVHPSPLSSHRGFFGSNIFIKIEDKLGKKINWKN